MQLEEDAGKEAKDDSDLELDPAETTRWGFRTKIWETQRENLLRMHELTPPTNLQTGVWVGSTLPRMQKWQMP